MLGRRRFDQLLKALSIVYGIEPYVVLKDIWDANDREVEEIGAVRDGSGRDLPVVLVERFRELPFPEGIAERVELGPGQQPEVGEPLLGEGVGLQSPPAAVRGSQLGAEGRKRPHARDPHDRERDHGLEQGEPPVTHRRLEH